MAVQTRVPVLEHPRGRAILGAIAVHWWERRISPSVRDLAAATQTSSPSVILYWLARLCADGYLEDRDRGIARSLVLTEAGWAAIDVLHNDTS